MINTFDTQTWLKYAQEDLDAAEILFREGFYRHAVFWVEQASEKIIKVFIISSHRIQNTVSKLGEVNEELYKIFQRFADPKTFGHICKPEDFGRLVEFYDRYIDILPHILLRTPSTIGERMKDARYKEAFRSIENAIGEAIKSLWLGSSAPICEELDLRCIIQFIRDVEERAGRAKGIISAVAEEVSQKHQSNEMAKQAVEDARHIYTCFVDDLASLTYIMLHEYLCQFFEASRYPGIEDIPKDLIDLLLQIIDLLRKNLERVEEITYICKA